MLILRKLTLADEVALKNAEEEFKQTPEFIFAIGHAPGMDLAEYLAYLDRFENGIGLPEGYVPSTMLFGFEGPTCVGRVMIRHRLNDFLLNLGGHIGYGVVPSCRRQGYATRMLKTALPIARLLGIERALVTCDDENTGSIKTIEANDGVLENKVSQGGGKPLKRRYWIDLA